MNDLLVTMPEELTATWLSQLTNTPVERVDVSSVGTGQIGAVYRITALEPSGQSRLVKLPAADPAARALLAGAYRGEVRFYSEIADTVAIRVPKTELAIMANDGAEFTLVMEDLAPGTQGDQIAGCSHTQALDSVVNLAGLHGPRWCDPTLLDIEGLSVNGPDDAALMSELFAPTAEQCIDVLGDRLDPEAADMLRRTATVIGPWALARPERFGLVHGDYRLDNLMFPKDGAAGVHAVDWQTLSLALPTRDLAYFNATSLLPDQRVSIERMLVEAYHDALVAYGVSGYTADQCWDDYRFAMLQAPLVTAFGCAYGARTERGDDMFATMLNRAAIAIRELDTFAMLSS